MYTIQDLKKQKLIIFEGIAGSRAYGTNMPNSDYDTRGVFIQPIKDILKYGYVQQISDKKNDIIYYELKRFLELVQTNNPNIMEILNFPEDMININTKYFDMIINHRDKFITTKCKNTFGGYAVAQIKKARGLKKKMNWDENEMVRKTVLDFCYVLNKGAQPFKKWIIKYAGITEGMDSYINLIQGNFGLSKIDHVRDLYALFNLEKIISINGYDQYCYGIVKNEESNDVHTVSIPKGINPIGYLSFNKDGYSTHCKRYMEYITWLENRNEDRFKMNKEHGKNYDSKNMSHCIRLLDMANEIALGKGINVRRTNEQIDQLLKIRKGKLEYDELLNMAEEKLKLMDINFNKSNLPKDIDSEFISQLIFDIRTIFHEKT